MPRCRGLAPIAGESEHFNVALCSLSPEMSRDIKLRVPAKLLEAGGV